MKHVIRAIEFGIRLAHFAIGVGSGSRVSMGEAASLRRLPPNAVIFDVGANVGQYAALARRHTHNARLFCFEPAKETYEALMRNIQNVETFNVALSDHPGTMTLHYDAPGSGLASFSARRLDHFGIDFSKSEAVEVDTIDRVCLRLRIDSIDLLKIDVEGHELAVLNGAKDMLARRAIKAVQFEYGGCNIDSRTYFQDFFYLFKKYGMTIHRITPFGYLYPIPEYREIDEHFRTSNFLATLI